MTVWYNSAMEQRADLAVLAFAAQTEWEAWLEENHAASKGIWLKMAKKASGIPSVTYPQALETALCYGWIDGQKAPIDETFWRQKFTPRGPKSSWSKINRDKAEALIAAGRMRPAGLLQVERARADGRWERAYDSQSKSTVPQDFQMELDRSPEARDFFLTLDSANRYAILYRIQTAKTAQTRSAWINKLVAMLANQQKIHP
jgi:uncharacterized protein YdeI (YjbR/CyaY-like superfamily)